MRRRGHAGGAAGPRPAPARRKAAGRSGRRARLWSEQRAVREGPSGPCKVLDGKLQADRGENPEERIPTIHDSEAHRALARKHKRMNVRTIKEVTSHQSCVA